MERIVKCPWCGQEASPLYGTHQGTNGQMRVTRCSQCHNLISVRLQDEPDDIIKKGLVKGV